MYMTIYIPSTSGKNRTIYDIDRGVLWHKHLTMIRVSVMGGKEQTTERQKIDKSNRRPNEQCFYISKQDMQYHGRWGSSSALRFLLTPSSASKSLESASANGSTPWSSSSPSSASTFSQSSSSSPPGALRWS